MKQTSALSTTEKIVRYNAPANPERLALKYSRDRIQLVFFLRGTCHLFFEQLPSHPILQEAPAAWICGDLHLEIGNVQGRKSLGLFRYERFRRSDSCPMYMEIVRLLTSIQIAAPALSLKREEAIELSRTCLHSYAEALSCGKARWIDRDAADA